MVLGGFGLVWFGLIPPWVLYLTAYTVSINNLQLAVVLSSLFSFVIPFYYFFPISFTFLSEIPAQTLLDCHCEERAL